MRLCGTYEQLFVESFIILMTKLSPTIVSTVERLKAQEERESTPQLFDICFFLADATKLISRNFFCFFHLHKFYQLLDLNCLFSEFKFEFTFVLVPIRNQFKKCWHKTFQWHWWRPRSSCMISRLKSNKRWTQKHILTLWTLTFTSAWSFALTWTLTRSRV